MFQNVRDVLRCRSAIFVAVVSSVKRILKTVPSSGQFRKRDGRLYHLARQLWQIYFGISQAEDLISETLTP